MAESFIGLVYGINARTSDLVCSSRAFTHIKPTLAALAKIRRLRQAGALQAEPVVAAHGSAVVRVPIELWNEVEREVIALAVQQARVEMIEEVVCQTCARQAAEEAAESALPNGGDDSEAFQALTDKLLAEARTQRGEEQVFSGWNECWIDCDEGCESRLEWLWEEWHEHIVKLGLNSEVSRLLAISKQTKLMAKWTRQMQEFTTLLASFGLYLPCKEVVADPYSLDLTLSDHTTVLAATLYKTPEDVFDTVTYFEGGSTTCELLDVPREALVLGAQVDVGFRRFLGQYHVTARAVSHTASTTQPKLGLKRDTPLVPCVPRWMVVANLTD